MGGSVTDEDRDLLERGQTDHTAGEERALTAKWWHVSDEKIAELILTTGSSKGSDSIQGALAAATQNRVVPPSPSFGRNLGVVAAVVSGSRRIGRNGAGTSPLSGSANVARSAGATSQSGVVEALSSAVEENSGVIVEKMRSSKVRFHGHEEEDVMEKMLREMRTMRLEEQATEQQQACAEGDDDNTQGNDWRVQATDEALVRHIEETVAKVDLESNFRTTLTKFRITGNQFLRRPMVRGLRGIDEFPPPNKQASGRAADSKISIEIYLNDSGDTLTLRVDPDLHVGFAPPPKANIFTERFGLGASTKGFADLKKGYDPSKRRFGDTNRAGWTPRWTNCLKRTIRDVTDLEVARQQLFSRYLPMCDEKTLREHGVQEGDTLHMSIRRVRKASDNSGSMLSPTKGTPKGSSASAPTLTLSSSLKRNVSANWEERRVDILNGKFNGAGSEFSLRHSHRLKDCKSDGDFWMKPKWVAQDYPELFAPVGCGVSGDGSMKAPLKFSEIPIYLPDLEASKVSRVRTNVSGHVAYQPACLREKGRYPL